MKIIVTITFNIYKIDKNNNNHLIKDFLNLEYDFYLIVIAI